MTYAYISDSGTREVNEDSYLAREMNGIGLFAVADGLGGHDKGEVASKVVIEALDKAFQNRSGVLTEAFLPDAFMSAHDALMQEQRDRRAANEMMTTCAAVLIADNSCRICHIGDTRAYVFRKNKIKLRTLDHSVPQMLVLSGEIKEKHIRGHSDRNRLLRVMGTQWDTPQFEVADEMPLSECQAFLLCSDGFWELCDERYMCKSLGKSTDVKRWLQMMTDEVLKNGKNADMDNYTAVAVIC